jgi:hypothetical protein
MHKEYLGKQFSGKAKILGTLKLILLTQQEFMPIHCHRAFQAYCGEKPASGLPTGSFSPQ